MENIKAILDKIMDTPAVEFVNVKEPDGIKLKAIMRCRKGDENEPKKDVSKVTYREFLISFAELYVKAPLGMVLSFQYDWAYFKGKSQLMNELTSLNYNKMIHIIANLFEKEAERKDFLESCSDCDITSLMGKDKDNTLEDYYKVVASLMVEGNKNKDNEEQYMSFMNDAVHIASNNILFPLAAYAKNSGKLL